VPALFLTYTLYFTLSAIQYFFMWLFYFLQSYLMANVADTLVMDLRKQVASKLNRLPLRFFDRNKAGEILSRSVGTIIGSICMMLYYSVYITLLFLVFMLLSTVITKIVSGKSLRYAGERMESIANLTGLAEEYYNGRNVIRAYNHEADSLEKIEQAAEKARIANQRVDFLSNCVNPLIRLLTRISHAAIALIAGRALLNGSMTVGVMQALFQYINLAAEPLTEASYMINSMQSALAAAERIFALLDEPEEIADPAVPVELSRAKGQIAFENVSFGYDPDRVLMKNISFTAQPGQKIAVVGSTGAGKTTLVNLLMRFYEVNGGRITVEGLDTSKMTRRGLRRNFGMVLQDSWLFSGTLAENIAYGRPDATRAEIEAAAKAAKIDYLIRTMPQGYDTIMSNEAANLSAGQKQLLTIARVFLCNPPILILDEATSSVDTRTEVEIGKAMKQLVQGRTSFVIAHRLSTIRDADTILFMEQGNIIEQGSHEELLAKGGAYAALYNSQFE
jgi:ATP-binding cassette, subfamily B, multidrug efflux pump